MLKTVNDLIPGRFMPLALKSCMSMILASRELSDEARYVSADFWDFLEVILDFEAEGAHLVVIKCLAIFVKKQVKVTSL